MILPRLFFRKKCIRVQLHDIGQHHVRCARRATQHHPGLELLGRFFGYVGSDELPCMALNARNLALSEQHNAGQEIVATCATCWLSACETKERLEEDSDLMRATNQALAEAGLKYEVKAPVRHMVGVLFEDFGYDELGKQVTNPLEGLRVASYVGCHTNRPFSIDGESLENSLYLDKLVEIFGAEPIKSYEKKVQCCGGALAFSAPKKSQAMIKGIIEAAYDNKTDSIATPCPVCPSLPRPDHC